MLDDAEYVVAWTLALAIAAGELAFVWWAGRKCLRRWRGGVLSRRGIAVEVFGVLLGVLFVAWGAAVVP